MVHDPLVEWGADNRGRKVSPVRPRSLPLQIVSNIELHLSSHFQKGGPKVSDRPDPRILEARKALDPVAQKLDGYLRTVDSGSRHSTSGNIYTTNHLVDLLIREASSNSNLAQMCKSKVLISELDLTNR